MTKSRILAALAAIVLICGLAVPYVTAQQRSGVASGGQGRGPAVALLDISYIFKNHAHFKSRMADMKSDVERAKTQMQKEAETIRNLAERMSDYRPGTTDYKSIEEEVAKRQADVQVKMQLQRKEFLQAEAKIYHTVYREILQEVDYFATANNIDIVLRFNGEPVDVEQPDDVLRDINKSVVWFANGLDITQDVLDRLNSRSIQAPGGQMGRPAHGVPMQR